MNDERAKRIGQNEALYRLVNEQIESINHSFGVVTGDFAVICECGHLDCQEQVTLATSSYEQVRADPAHFIIKPGHEMDEFEDIIAATATYAVVAKKSGTPAQVASETDPRS